MNFVKILAGKFMMGSPLSEVGRFDDEDLHEVTIKEDFEIMDTQVTQKQWQDVMGSNPSYFKNNPDNPVETVSWNDVQEFIKKLNEKNDGYVYDLPTEEQWEYACRAGTQTAYSFGDDPKDLKDYAWYWENSENTTHPVKQKKPNAWGLYDMHGNVWEWCKDVYDKYK
jgi:formylglycine-generating enzyme required for sulfatase activity